MSRSAKKTRDSSARAARQAWLLLPMRLTVKHDLEGLADLGLIPQTTVYAPANGADVADEAPSPAKLLPKQDTLRMLPAEAALGDPKVVGLVYSYLDYEGAFAHRAVSRGHRRVLKAAPLRLTLREERGVARGAHQLCAFLAAAAESDTPLPANLTELSFDADVSDADTRALAVALHFGTAPRLELLRVQIGPDGGDAAAAVLLGALEFRPRPPLRTLDLQGSYVGPAGLQRLGQLISKGALPGLETLKVMRNGAGARGARMLATALKRSAGSPGLVQLYLGRNDIGAGAGAVFTVLKVRSR